MRHHICNGALGCTCDRSALEPDEDCPVHGHGPWPPRCRICGRYMSYAARYKGTHGVDMPEPEEEVTP
jgi:hypothetical protein